MRRFSTLYITPILAIIIIVIKIPEVEKWLHANYANAPILIVLILVISTILNHVITVISPFKKYEKIEKNKWILVDSITESFLGKQLFPSFHLVANVMVPRVAFFCSLVPCEKRNFWCKIKCFFRSFFVMKLHPIWLSNNHTLDKRFRITTKQGATGLAFSHGKVTIVDLTQGINDLNLNNIQKMAISGMGFVISYPIFSLDEKYNRLSTEIIGVVTLSCTTLGAEKLIQDQINREILTNKVVSFSKLCSLIL